MKKKIVLLAIIFATVTFGCNKNISKPVSNQKTYSTLTVSNDTVFAPKKKGVCEGCSHQ